jgi:hypothetical protein
MNKEHLKEVRKTIKDLHKKHILMIQLDIVYELDCQLDFDISDEDYCKLYNEIEHAYLKVEDIDIGVIVKCALDNKDIILNEDTTFSLRDECGWYV